MTSNPDLREFKQRPWFDFLAIGLATVSIILTVGSTYLQFFDRRLSATATITDIAAEELQPRTTPPSFRVIVTFAFANGGDKDVLIDSASVWAVYADQSSTKRGEQSMADPLLLKPGEVSVRKASLKIWPIVMAPSGTPSKSVKLIARVSLIAPDGNLFETSYEIAHLNFSEARPRWSSAWKREKFNLLQGKAIGPQTIETDFTFGDQGVQSLTTTRRNESSP
jgi:hypothetical protein